MRSGPLDSRSRQVICPGLRVRIIRKSDQGSGRLTEGIVSEILTNSAFHPHGIKVRLGDGTVGRVKEICGTGKGDDSATRGCPGNREGD